MHTMPGLTDGFICNSNIHMCTFIQGKVLSPMENADSELS